MENKREKREKLELENRGFITIFILVSSATLLLSAWALFVMLYFANVLAKIIPFKRKFGKGKDKPNKNEQK